MRRTTTGVRRRRGRDETRRLVEEMDRLGLNAREFADREGVTPVTVHRWRQLAGQGRSQSPLIPVRLLDGGGAGRAGDRIEVVLRSGHRLRVGDGVAPARLAEIVRLLEGGGC